MIRFLLIILLLLPSFVIAAEKLLTTTNKYGDVFIRVLNDTPYHLTCQIWNDGYFVDFTVAPGSSSRWYIEPIHDYKWECIQ